MYSNRLLVLVAIALLGSCGDERDTGSRTALPASSLPGVYTGVFPCQGCPGIPTTLWLRPDERFFYEQQYPGVDGHEGINAYNLGHWTWSVGDQRLVLEGAGPGRAFTRLDKDTLLMLNESDLEHLLSRDPAAPEFARVIRMTGTISVRSDVVSFTECLTGLVAPVTRGGDFARFRHQYRSVGERGRPAHVELEGHFSWSDDNDPQSMTIDRFITVKADESC